MTDDTTRDAPRRDIATSSARALRAARTATPAEPVVDPVVDPEVTPEVTATAEPTSEPEVEPVDAAAAEPVDDAPPVLATSRRTPASDNTASSSDSTARRRPGRATVVAAGVAVAALAFGVVSGVVWWRAGHADARTTATSRDEVVVDARVAIGTVNASDYRKPDVALRNWLAVSTGTLKSQFADSRASAVKLLAQAKVVTSATVLDAAVTKLDTGKGSATVIASVNVKRQPATGAATTTRNRFRATLTRVNGDWKLADLALVPVALT